MDETLDIRALTETEGAAAVEVINAAASWYAEFLPAEEAAEPEMTFADWRREGERMVWYGAFTEDGLTAVVGLEYVHDAALFRHAYVRPDHQRRGVMTALYQHLEPLITDVELLIAGTYAANYQARNGLEKAGYVLSENSEAVLRRYYDIPGERLQTSVTYEKHLG